MKSIVLFADGGSRGNPGPAAYGFVLYEIDADAVFEDGELLSKHALSDCEELHAEGVYIGETTNNQAEWGGVKAALEWIAQSDTEYNHVYICLDSQLVVRQITGMYKVKNEGLKPLHNAVMATLTDLPPYSAFHVYRKYNKRADSLVNEALDAKEPV